MTHRPKMTVWVVTWHIDYECGEADAVFATEALAREYAAAADAESSIERYEVTEFVVRNTAKSMQTGCFDAEQKRT